MTPELLIAALRIAFPSTCSTRGRAISGIMTMSGYRWKEGEVGYNDGETPEEVVEALDRLDVEPLASLDWDAELLKSIMRREEKSRLEESGTPKTREQQEEYAQRYMKRIRQDAEWPIRYNLNGNAKTIYGEIIAKVPDDVTEAWLAVCVEFLVAVCRSKTDYNSTTILSAEELGQRELLKSMDANKNSKQDMLGLVEEICSELGVAGHPADRKAEIAAKIADRVFNDSYGSAKQRAKSVNADNIASILVAQRIYYGELKQRFESKYPKLFEWDTTASTT